VPIVLNFKSHLSMNRKEKFWNGAVTCSISKTLKSKLSDVVGFVFKEKSKLKSSNTSIHYKQALSLDNSI